MTTNYLTVDRLLSSLEADPVLLLHAKVLDITSLTQKVAAVQLLRSENVHDGAHLSRACNIRVSSTCSCQDSAIETLAKHNALLPGPRREPFPNESAELHDHEFHNSEQ
jgi:hypothetical protein